MALTNKWKNKTDGVDDVLAEDINGIAQAVIELEGKPTVRIDEAYNPLSSNAQSGTAVAQAVQGKADYEYVNRSVAGLLNGYKDGEKYIHISDVSRFSPDIMVTGENVKAYGKNLANYTGVLNNYPGSSFLKYLDLLVFTESVVSAELANESGTIESYYYAVFRSNNNWGSRESVGVLAQNTVASKPVIIQHEVGYSYRLVTTDPNYQINLKTVQVEAGNQVTTYEQFKEATVVDGMVRGFAPITNLVAGGKISAEYQRDLNITINNLEQAIANI